MGPPNPNPFRPHCPEPWDVRDAPLLDGLANESTAASADPNLEDADQTFDVRIPLVQVRRADFHFDLVLRSDDRDRGLVEMRAEVVSV